MSSFRPRGSGSYHNHYRTEPVKSGPPPPPVLNSGGGRPAERHYNERERHRSRSPGPGGFAHHGAPRDAPLRHQEPISRPPPRQDDLSQRIAASRRAHSPQVGPSRYQDQPSSREHTSRQAEPRKRTPVSSRRSPSPRNTKKQTSSSTSTAKSSKSKPSHDSHSHNSSAAATPGHSSKPSRSSAPNTQESIMDIINQSQSVEVVRAILNPNDVKIPRRAGEGAKPIFDRDELRDSILKRMEAGDTEQNPVKTEPIEQRVVAIIREPVLIDPYAATVPSSSTKKHSQDSHTEKASSRSRHRGHTPELLPTSGTTSSGVPYRINAASPPPYAAKRPRSVSPIRPPPPERERERFDIDRRRDMGRDLYTFANFGGESSREFNHNRRERTRSRSPVDRVRRVTLNPAPGPASGSFAERDLRETLSRGPKADHLAPVSREFLESRGTFRGRGLSRGGFTRRPRGAFISRGRAIGRRAEPQWQHDKFERDGENSGNPA